MGPGKAGPMSVRYVVQRSGTHYGEYKWDVHEVGENGAIEPSIVARSSVRQDADNVCAALNERGSVRALQEALAWWFGACTPTDPVSRFDALIEFLDAWDARMGTSAAIQVEMSAWARRARAALVASQEPNTPG